jgi:hypothetical protein
MKSSAKARDMSHVAVSETASDGKAFLSISIF